MPTHARHKKVQDRPVVMYFLTCGCRSFSLISQSGQSKLSNRRSSIADIFLKFQGMIAVQRPLVTTHVAQVVSGISGSGHLGLQDASGKSFSGNFDFYSKCLFKCMIYIS